MEAENASKLVYIIFLIQAIILPISVKTVMLLWKISS